MVNSPNRLAILPRELDRCAHVKRALRVLCFFCWTPESQFWPEDFETWLPLDASDGVILPKLILTPIDIYAVMKQCQEVIEYTFTIRNEGAFDAKWFIDDSSTDSWRQLLWGVILTGGMCIVVRLLSKPRP